MKWIVRIVGALLVLVLLLIGGVFLLPAERVARIAADQLRIFTGRDVTISGDVSLSIWPVLGAEVGNLEIGNADWSEQGPMLSTQKAAIGLDARALLGGDIRITRISAASPVIRLESRADGRASWQFTDASGTASIETTTTPEAAPRSLSIAQLEVTDATLIYDAEGADLLTYSGVDLSVDWPEVSGPAEINALLRPTDDTVAVAARIEAFSGFLGGAVQGVNVTLETPSGKVDFDGRAALSGDLAGKLVLDVADSGRSVRALGLPGADLPVGLGRSVIGAADITLTGDRELTLRNLAVDLGGNRLNGAADVSLNGTPQITARLDAGDLDLRPLVGGAEVEGSGSGAAAGASGWSRAPIDASGLAAFNGEIVLSARSVETGSLRLGETRATLRNDRARMVFDLSQVQAYGGTLSGEFVMNNRNGLSVGGSLSGDALQLEGLLNDLMGVNRLRGPAAARVKFLGVGETVHDIMNSLSGDGQLSLGTGTITGLDLDTLMQTGVPGGGTTVYDSLSATFTMAQGVLRNEDLLLSLPNVEARGAGQIGLGARNLDYLFTPVALKANSGRGLAIPVRVRGPWAAPQIQPDLQAAVEMNLAEEKKKVERQVRDKIEDRVKEELGVATEDGQSLGDAIEQELGNRLRKLFD